VNKFRNGDVVYTLADIDKMTKRIAELEEEVQELTNQLIAMHKGELHD
jgi:hypothetical protein